MPWETDESSGFLTHITGTIKEAWFDTDPRYMDGDVLLLHWEIDVEEVHQTYDGDVPDELTFSMPVGSGWVTDDKETATHPRGKETFHASSWYGRVIDAVVGKVANYGTAASRTNNEDLEVDLEGLLDAISAKGDPTQADVWVGVRAEFDEVEVDFGPDRKDKTKRMTSRRVVPIRYLPEAAAKKAKATAKKAAGVDKAVAAKAKAQAAAAKAKAANGADPLDFVTDDDVRAQLQTVLDDSADFTAFTESAVEIPEVIADDALLEKVLDPDNGPWASKALADA